MKGLIALLVSGLVLGAFSFSSWAGNLNFQPEPPIDTKVGWHTESNGMLIIGFDRDHNGWPDFFTVRIVITHYFSQESLETIKTYYPGRPVFQVSYSNADYFYVAQEHPLFYAIDMDEDGHWDNVFRDILEDGVNGNEIPWENTFQHYPSNRIID